MTIVASEMFISAMCPCRGIFYHAIEHYTTRKRLVSHTHICSIPLMTSTRQESNVLIFKYDYGKKIN